MILPIFESSLVGYFPWLGIELSYEIKNKHNYFIEILGIWRN
jgi:hypothetical protein